MSQATTISFGGVEIDLPASLPFSHTSDGDLCLDFGAGFRGRLVLRQSKQASRETALLPLEEQTGLAQRHGSPAMQSRLPQIHEAVIPDSQPISTMPAAPWFFDPSAALSDDRLDEDAASPAAKPENDCQTLKNAELTSIPDSSEPQRPLATENDSDSDQDLLPDQSVSPCEPAAQATSVPLGSGDPGAETLPVNGPERGSALGVWQQLDNQHANSKKTTPVAQAKPGKENTHVVDDSKKIPKSGKRKGEANGNASTRKRSGVQKSRQSLSNSTEMTFRWQAVTAKEGAEQPDERWGATFTVLNDSQVCLYGGDSHKEQFGDTWILDISSQPTWQRTKVPADRTKAWHCTTVAAASEVPSSIDEGEDEVNTLSDVCQLDLEAGLWTDMPISGEQLQRSGHSATRLPDGRILIFGGVDGTGRHHNSSHIIDLKRLNCFSLTGGVIRGAPPKPRAYHSATLVGSHIVVLGGTGNRVWSMKEVYTLSVQTMQWREHTASVEGDAPSPRSGHSAVALPGDRYLLVYGGGLAERDTFYSTLAVLDTHSWVWFNPQIQSIDRPKPRSGHVMSLVKRQDGSQVLALFGGRTQGDQLCSDTWLLDFTLP